MASQALFLGRQPILDRNRKLVAYELLFRTGLANWADVTDDLMASVTVIAHAFTEFGVEKALGPHKGFINADESLLTSDLIALLPRDKVVLELLETIEYSPRVFELCQHLKTRGFQMALDDFSQITGQLEAFLDLVDVVKVDIPMLSQEALARLAKALGARRRLILLAEKVDSREQFEFCKSLGFHLFQGYFFARPHIIAGKRMAQSELALLKLLGQIMSDEADAMIENTLKQYPAVSLNLLRLANSAAFGTQHTIRSIRSAIQLLGRHQMRRWLQVLLYTNQNTEVSSGHNPLLVLAATRGKLMEALALKGGDGIFAENAFMTGIFSLLDVLFSVPMKDILENMPLDNTVVEALQERRGELGKLLDLVVSLEQSTGNGLGDCLKTCAFLSLEDVNTAQIQALEWANSIEG